MNLQYSKCNDLDIENIYNLSKDLIDQYEDIQNIEYNKVLNWVKHKLTTNIKEDKKVYYQHQLVGYYCTIKENDSTMDKGKTKVTQEPVNGYVSEAYRIVKDSNGNEISRTLISKDKYNPTNEIIKVGTKQKARYHKSCVCRPERFCPCCRSKCYRCADNCKNTGNILICLANNWTELYLK